MTEPQQEETGTEPTSPTTIADETAAESVDAAITDEVSPVTEEAAAQPADEPEVTEDVAAVAEVVAEPAEVVEAAATEAEPETVAGLSAEDLEAAPAAEPEPEPVIDTRPEPTTMEELLNEQEGESGASSTAMSSKARSCASTRTRCSSTSVRSRKVWSAIASCTVATPRRSRS